MTQKPSTITAAGLDFLEDGGGLSAILGVVTVRLHADTVRALIDAKIEASPIPAEEKSRLRKVLAHLSEASLRVATTDLVKSGLDHCPTRRVIGDKVFASEFCIGKAPAFNGSPSMRIPSRSCEN